MQKTKLKFYDLFSGIGGFRLGLERAGHVCVGSCEIDQYARQIHEKNFGSKPEQSDATKIIPKQLPDFDILCAGFPCQAFSIAGRRFGFEDTRGTLFFEIARIAREKRPRYLFLENVKGLLSHARGKTFAEILATLDELRYDAEWQVFNSKYFVPQNRERIFIIGHNREKRTRKIFPIGEFHQKTSGEKKDRQECTAIDSNYWKGIDNHGARTMIQVGNVGKEKNKNPLWSRVYDPNGISATIKAEGGGWGAKTGLYKMVAWSKSTREWGTESRLKEDEANTLNTGDGCSSQSTRNFIKVSDVYERKVDSIGRKRPLHYTKKSGIRKLTPLECERLQGFPDKWTEDQSDTQRYKCLGNAVTVPVITYIGEKFD